MNFKINAKNFPLIFASNDSKSLDERKRSILYNCEVEYFARVLTSLQQAFGHENVIVMKYNGHPATMTNPGHAHICVKNYATFFIRTDMHYFMNSTYPKRIETMRGIIDESNMEQVGSRFDDIRVHRYRSSQELINAIRDTPAWKKKLQDSLSTITK